MIHLQSRAQVSLRPPSDFSSGVSVSACYIESAGKFLLLRCAQGKKEAGLWGFPGGKAEPGETPLRAMVRELKEETGMVIEPGALLDLGPLYIRRPDIDFTCHMFCLLLQPQPDVQLSTEHDASRWLLAHELDTLPLIPGARGVYLRVCQALPGAKKRAIASISSYLILMEKNRVLLGLRKNTGYCDGMWSLPAGHVEEGEPASAGMIREAEEEIGIRLNPSQLKVVHVMHRQSNRFNVDIFFRSTQWEGEIENKEPEKCEKLSFFPMGALPKNLVGYNRQVLEGLSQETFYSEPGWE